MNEKLKDNIGSLVRLGCGWLGGYLAGKGIVLDVAGLGEIIISAIPVVVALWAWWHNRDGVKGVLSH